jgi:hypothetical protein
MLSNEEIALLYGKNAIVSRKGRFTLIHLDRPSRAVVRARTREFDPERFFDGACPVCQLLKQGGVVVFDDTEYGHDEEIPVD